MCGIAGIWGNGIGPDSIRMMVDTLRHRGPDAQGIYFNEQRTLAFGHTRLSVIDLSENANQPMSTPDGRYTIIFNGEIYNFRQLRKEILQADPSVIFKTKSDSETILYAFNHWRQQMVSKLEGMFALAIYDAHQHQLFLCRDRVGKKPLYYYQSGQLFIFASELKAILRHPSFNKDRAINKKACNYFLHLGYIPEPLTIYSHVKKFPAGYYGFLDARCILDLKPFWNADDYISKKIFKNDAEAKSGLRNSLVKATEDRLISDVPIGAFLSGGTDSSLVTAIASRIYPGRLKTFCIGFKENKYNESVYAREVAGYLNTDHLEYILSEKEAIDILENYLNILMNHLQIHHLYQLCWFQNWHEEKLPLP
jgi:asparagine synthase (glutamine-hydrolysing)